MDNCPNCQNLKRWDEVLYKPYLKTAGANKEWIKNMKEIDKRYLPCLNKMKLEKCLHLNTIDVGDADHIVVLCTDCEKDLRPKRKEAN